MTVREVRPSDLPSLRAMMLELWPEAGDYDFRDETTFVWEHDEVTLGGFISVSVRPWAEGCHSSPLPYIEGWWVAPDLRGQGIGRLLVEAVEQWCKERAYVELGSDAEAINQASHEAHAALGFQPTIKLQYFRKRLQ